ncbi:MAG TPA: response regulator transcription factor [Gammaproteobacteria bacterium]|nr:response regulator transcription factor [Gammaproteobacteria bacterium]
MERERNMPTENDAPRRIQIASGDNDLVMRFASALEQNFMIDKWSGNNSTSEIFSNGTPDLVLLDPKYFSEPITGIVAEISDSNHALRIIVIENQTDRQVDQYALFKAGAHGFCKDNISEALLNRAAQMVCEGEYWIQRKLIAKMINDLAQEMTQNQNPVAREGHPVIDALTPRELEVAEMVRLGGNNKMIARKLDISERTVKAHLSAIFRKLDIQNRLHLALYFNDTN